MGTNNSRHQLTQRANDIQMIPKQQIKAVKCSKTAVSKFEASQYDSQLDMLWGPDNQIGIFNTLTSLAY